MAQSHGSQTSVLVSITFWNMQLTLTRPWRLGVPAWKAPWSRVLPTRGPGTPLCVLARARAHSWNACWANDFPESASLEVNSPCFPCLRGLPGSGKKNVKPLLVLPPVLREGETSPSSVPGKHWSADAIQGAPWTFGENDQ